MNTDTQKIDPAALIADLDAQIAPLIPEIARLGGSQGADKHKRKELEKQLRDLRYKKVEIAEAAGIKI